MTAVSALVIGIGAGLGGIIGVPIGAGIASLVLGSLDWVRGKPEDRWWRCVKDVFRDLMDELFI